MTLPDGKVPVILTFGDWRDVEGVKFPFAIDEERVSFPPQTFAIYTERIELNPAVDDAMFRMPGDSSLPGLKAVKCSTIARSCPFVRRRALARSPRS